MEKKRRVGDRTENETSQAVKHLMEEASKVRRNLFPIQYTEIFNHYKKQSSVYWVVEEIDTSKDAEWFQGLMPEIFGEIQDPKNEKEMEVRYEMVERLRYIIISILLFFSQADKLINEHIDNNMSEIAKEIPEVDCFEKTKQAIEVVHQETYQHLIDTYIKDPEEKDKAFRAVENYEYVAKKTEWIYRYSRSPGGEQTYSKGEVIFAIALGEGLQFSGLFSFIAWLESRGVVNGLTTSNEPILRDENIHMIEGLDFLILFDGHKGKYKDMGQKLEIYMPPTDVLIRMIKEVTEIEKEFMSTIMGEGLSGMTIENMHTYLEFRADQILKYMKIPEVYNVENPFKFMDAYYAEKHHNFFEVRSMKYERVKRSHQTSTIGEDQLSSQIKSIEVTKAITFDPSSFMEGDSSDED